jgi:acetolactate synthase-1/2/3 large subunit
MRNALALIEAAKFPVLFLGMRTADPSVVEAVHDLLRKHPMPVVETFQAGAILKPFLHLFFG